MAWLFTLCNKFKQLLIQKLRSKIAKVKVASTTIINNISSTKTDSTNQYSCILILASIYKKALCFFIVVITHNKNRLDKQTALSQEQVQTNQSSDMNVISTKLFYPHFLNFILLSKARFSGMSMYIVDNKEITLWYIVKFTLNI